MNKRPYLIKNRLSDVLSLIQVLALDKHGHRSDTGLKNELQGNPKSAESWTAIAKAHPEFFRVAEEGEHQVSLVARHVTEINDNGVRTLPPDIIKTLIQIALELYDKQKEMAGWWKVWLPIMVAIFTVFGSFFVQYKSNENQNSLKHFEVELKPKQDGYANYMKAISYSFYHATRANRDRMIQSLDQAEMNFYILEPFLSGHDRERIWDQFQQFSSFCYRIVDSNIYIDNQAKTVQSLIWYRDYFRTNLYSALFKHK
jgi:hypothetical protein